MEKALHSKPGLILILVALFGFNFAETQLEELLNTNATFDQGFKIAQAFDQMEGLIRFNNHAQPSLEAIGGLSLAYFVLFPLLMFSTALALGFRRQLRPFRVYTLSLTFNYFLSLPFFLFFPVPERWTYPASNAVLLSDMLSTKLIEFIRPISGLDNSFPSVHVAFSIITLLVAYRYRLQYRHTIACVALIVVLATFALGIHWIPDLIMGAVMAVMAFGLAIVFDRRYADVVSEVPVKIARVKPQAVPEPVVVAPSPLVQQPVIETPPSAIDKVPAANVSKHQVFISYRRELGSDLARNISLAMKLKGISCFLDVDDLGARHFDKRLLKEIETTPNFVVILTPGALDNCQASNDWLRKEIGHAISCKCNIVPLLIDGFRFPDPETLPEDLRDLVRHNGVSHSHEYFEASINKLQHFLSLD